MGYVTIKCGSQPFLWIVTYPAPFSESFKRFVGIAGTAEKYFLKKISL